MSEFPFGDKTYKKFNAALDAFAAIPQSKIAAYSDVKRALLQRHLWKVVDTTTPYRGAALLSSGIFPHVLLGFSEAA